MFEKSTDSEVAMFLAHHIDYPCGIEVENAVINIRKFYLREAKKVLRTFTNPEALAFLEAKIREY